MTAATQMRVSTCAVCSLQRNCAEMLGLMLGLDRWTRELGYIPDGVGGTIGLALQHSLLADQDCDRAMQQPYRDKIAESIGECRNGLKRFQGMARRRCAATDVPPLLQAAEYCQIHAWDAAGLVYVR